MQVVNQRGLVDLPGVDFQDPLLLEGVSSMNEGHCVSRSGPLLGKASQLSLEQEHGSAPRGWLLGKGQEGAATRC